MKRPPEVVVKAYSSPPKASKPVSVRDALRYQVSTTQGGRATGTDPWRHLRAGASRAEFNAALSAQWVGVWQQIRLAGLPRDTPSLGLEVAAREPHLPLRLRDQLRQHFVPLYDVFACYAIFPPPKTSFLDNPFARLTGGPGGGGGGGGGAAARDGAPSRRLTRAQWLLLVSESELLGKKTQPTTDRNPTWQSSRPGAYEAAAAAQLFDAAMGRRKPPPAPPAPPAEGANGEAAAETPDVSEDAAAAAASDDDAYAGLDFSGFLELLVHCACWKSPPTRDGPLEAAHVLRAAAQLVAATLLRGARRADVLSFRSSAFSSSPLMEALLALRPHLSSVHAAYSDGGGDELGGTASGRPGVRLPGFQRMVAEAGLASAIPSEDVVRAFAFALPIGRVTADPALGAGAEFEEAVLRLTRARLVKGGLGTLTKPTAGNATSVAVFTAIEEAELLEELPVLCSRLGSLAC